MSKSAIKTIVWIIVLAVIVIAGAAYFFRPTPQLPKPVQIDTQNQPTLGNSNAKVHIVAFEDLKCHNCARFNTLLLPKIKKKYIETGIAKYTVINLAFIDGSMPAANAARCLYAQNPKLFFPYVKKIYFNQPPETQNWATIPNLIKFSAGIKGVNQAAFMKCLLNSPYVGVINHNLMIAEKAMGDTIATPTIYINGVIVRPLTMKHFEAIMQAVR